MKATKFAVCGATLALVAVTACLALSIESEPVKVTLGNSGPRYDIDDMSDEKPKLNSLSQQAPPTERPVQQPPVTTEASREGTTGEQDTPIGHVAIRRIFLFPMMRPAGDSWGHPDSVLKERHQQPPLHEHEQMPSMFAKPFWPFMTPARPSPHNNHEREHEHPQRPHLFGADEASRSPPHPDQDRAASGEREDQPSIRPPMFDPIQLMVDLMHQAINSQLAPTDLTNNKDDTNNKSNDNSPAESSDERPQLPPGADMIVKPTGIIRPTQNETREDVVEIEGKKYSRKVVINRHVGDNLIFMTKRLIFVPINETDSTTETVATTSKSTIAVDATTMVPLTPEAVDRVGENKPVTTTKPAVDEATTAASATTAPSDQTTPSPSTEQSAATTPANSESSFVERVSDAIEKAAERLVKEARASSTTSTTTERPQAA